MVTKDDFTPGASRAQEVERTLESIRHVILVLSPSFLRDDWATWSELLASHSEVASRRRDTDVIPILLEPCELPLHLDYKVRLDCTRHELWESSVARLRTLLGRQAQPDDDDVPCPYPGITPFRAENRDVFHGRSREIEYLTFQARYQSLILVVGPSGIGKSSIALAGVMPALADERPARWRICLVEPSPTPFNALSQALSGRVLRDVEHLEAVVDELMSNDAAVDRLLLTVDQFEAVFSQASTAERARFVGAVEALRSRSDICFMLILRADFYGEFMMTRLWPVGESQRLDIGPLGRSALKECIVSPAARVGVHLEPVLVDRLLRDCADEPGALPLLQETLVLLWRRRDRRLLSLTAYEELAGEAGSALSVALVLHADAALATLTSQQQETARRVLLRLVQHGEGRPDTRRRQPMSALRSAASTAEEVVAVVEHLAGHRILTLSGVGSAPGQGVDLAHESLIRHWPFLSRAVDESRSNETQRRLFEMDAAAWADAGFESSRLYRGRRLVEAHAWSRQHPSELGATARRFLRSGRRRRLAMRVAVGLVLSLTVAGLAGWLIPLYQDYRWRTNAIALGPQVVVHGGRLSPAARLGPITVPALRVDVHEVTNEQYSWCVRASRCALPRESPSEPVYSEGSPHLPVVNVSGVDAANFCSWTGRRLPTLPEWLWAATGSSGSPYPWGTDPPTAERVNAVVDPSTPPTGLVPVQSGAYRLGATSEGIEHLIGNAQEWVATVGAAGPGSAPTYGGDWDRSDSRVVLVLAGGSYVGLAQPVLDTPSIAEATYADDTTGFRCVQSTN